MEEILQLSTTTVSGSQQFTETATYYPTSSAHYQLFYNTAVLEWQMFLILTAGIFFVMVYFFMKRFNR